MKKIATLKKLQQENANGLYEIGESVSYIEYLNNNYFSALIENNNGCEIFRAKCIRNNHEEDFYKFSDSSKNSLNTLFDVRDESTGDLLVVFVADLCKDGRVQSTLILTNTAWQEVLSSSQKVMRVEQFYLHVLEKQLQISA